MEVLCGLIRGLIEYILLSLSREMVDEFKLVVGRLRSVYSDVLWFESR